MHFGAFAVQRFSDIVNWKVKIIKFYNWINLICNLQVWQHFLRKRIITAKLGVHDILTHFWSKIPLYTPWEHQKTKDFLVFLGGYKMGTFTRNGLTMLMCFRAGWESFGPCIRSMVAFFGKIVIGWKLQTIFTKELHHKYLAGSKYAGEAKIFILISRLSLLMSRGIMQTIFFWYSRNKSCLITFNTCRGYFYTFFENMFRKYWYLIFIAFMFVVCCMTYFNSSL